MSGLSLVFHAGTLLCALGLADIAEVMRPLPIQALAGTPYHVRGVSVVRGVPTPVLDLARMIGDPGGDAAIRRFITLRSGGVLATGTVLGVRAVRPEDGREAPMLEAVTAVGVLDAQPLLFLDGAALGRTVGAYA